MNRRIWTAAAVVLALLAVGLSLTLRPAAPSTAINNKPLPAATELPLPLPAEPAVPAGWRVGIYEGHVAVFAAGTETPEQVLETAVASLPVADREALRRGIFVSDRKALAALLEDYDG